MNENQTNTVYCKYCKELINEHAKVCCHCGHYQNKFYQYIKYCVSLSSIGLLVVSIWQYNEARRERVDAKEALDRAKMAEKKIRDSSKAISKGLLALSTVKGDIDSLDVLKFFPSIMKNAAESLLDTIEASDEERQEIFGIYNRIEKWQQLNMQSDHNHPNPSEIMELEKEIKQQLNR